MLLSDRVPSSHPQHAHNTDNARQLPDSSMKGLSRAFQSPWLVFLLGLLLRVTLLLWSGYQDSHSPVKYTDIDYFVFTDAARAVHHGQSPYVRATYRYTPLLAWILLPTSWSGKNGLWFHSGKVLFALADLVVGGLVYGMLKRRGLDRSRALKFASVWLLNPMVANISTRGSSEALLCALITATLYAFEARRILLAGVLLGLSVHFKIYPFIYGVSMFWALKSNREPCSNYADVDGSDMAKTMSNLLNRSRVTLLASATTSFTLLNLLMYHIYGRSFIQHTFLYHFTRTDHRHNYSVYNTLLYLASTRSGAASMFSPERLAFVPQLLLSAVLLPLQPVTQVSLASTMMAQTLAFVTFNKVCTAQYFLWYLVFLPLTLPDSSLIHRPRTGLMVLGAWVGAQAIWLSQGFQLEFLGRSSFVGGFGRVGLWEATIMFFMVNCYILHVWIQDGMSICQRRLDTLHEKQHVVSHE